MQEPSGVQWPATANFGLAHGTELVYTFGAYQNEDYGTRMPWEEEIGTFLGRKMDQMINGEISDDRPFGLAGNVAKITNTATGVDSGSFLHRCWLALGYSAYITYIFNPGSFEVVSSTYVKTSERILDWLLFHVRSSIGCMEKNWRLRSWLSRWP